MIQPIKFPNQYDVIREEAVRHLRLSPSERLGVTAELMAMGRRMVEQNPQRDLLLQMELAQEEAWQQAQRKIFARYEA
jgi:hypothetical protein